ncbi:hypothetical protein AN280_22135 [Pseudomonas aeruginosa]|nr:hypothetical protein ATC05_24035 [Pseudomonas aeruginosa]KQJ53198.1 hypothetical protein AN280_22135 [Pseudomonas aeruginosa]KSC31409.1 hypothetical protein AO889_06755 [Pseudomonas aeruginosa]KXE41431.1 hypothetical protein AW924_09435 [Pseudomonas aeruginosa]KXE49303.1 hypothetical protein AW925_09570 [Pseudomonas aeruginosa]
MRTAEFTELAQHKVHRIALFLGAHLIKCINHQSLGIAQECSRVMTINQLASGAACIAWSGCKPFKQMRLSHAGFAEND